MKALNNVRISIHVYPDHDWYYEEEGVPSYKSDDFETIEVIIPDDCDDVDEYIHHLVSARA